MTREEAIDVLEKEKRFLFHGSLSDKFYEPAFDMAIEALQEPEQKKGKWIEAPDPYEFFASIPVCSECGCTTELRQTYKYCPNCGAKMDEKERMK